MSEPKHSGVNIRVLKALGGVALLATLEEPGDCEAELTVLGTKVCMRQVTNRYDTLSRPFRYSPSSIFPPKV